MAFVLDLSAVANTPALAIALAESERYFDSQRAIDPTWDLGSTLVSFTEVPGSPNTWVAAYQTQIRFSSDINHDTGDMIFTPIPM